MYYGTYRCDDALEGGPLGAYYAEMFARVDAIIAVMCSEGLSDDEADAIRRHAVSEDDAEFAAELWPDDHALDGKEWAKLIARCAADGAPPEPVPVFNMTLEDVLVALSPNVVRLPARP